MLHDALFLPQQPPVLASDLKAGDGVKHGQSSGTACPARCPQDEQPVVLAKVAPGLRVQLYQLTSARQN
eukprot:scaffold288753_cov38-Prasinocladus_malaysianus.AAC.1